MTRRRGIGLTCWAPILVQIDSLSFKGVSSPMALIDLISRTAI